MKYFWQSLTVLVLGTLATASAQTPRAPIFGDPKPNMAEVTGDPHSYFLDEADMYNTYKSRNRGMFGERALGLSTTIPGRSNLFQGNGVMRSANGSFIGINRNAPASMFKPYHPPEAYIQAESQPAQIIAPNARVSENYGFSPNQLPPPVVASGEIPGRIEPTEQAVIGWIRPLDEGPPAGQAEAIWMRDTAPPDNAAEQRENEYRDWSAGRTAQQSQRENQVVAGRVARMIVQTPGVGATAPITVSVVNGAAVIRGEVATDYGRRLAEQIARNDPGIGPVRNLLTVKGQARVVPSRELPAGAAQPRSNSALPPGRESRLPVAAPQEDFEPIPLNQIPMDRLPLGQRPPEPLPAE